LNRIRNWEGRDSIIGNKSFSRTTRRKGKWHRRVRGRKRKKGEGVFDARKVPNLDMRNLGQKGRGRKKKGPV